MRAVRRLGLISVVLVLVLVDATPALATHERYVTIAARVCDDYSSITGNRARNNIMESLRDLGADTPYGTRVGDRLIPNLVDPAIEAEFQPPPGCRPLAGWEFKLGTGIIGRADAGIWGELSRVTGPYGDPAILTRESVPLRDQFGLIDGDETLAGATTIQLTTDQVTQSTSGAKLWIQGGVPGRPITGDPNVYAFAALRCATDNLNGDNVEWIAYPVGGVKHVFCFAYYVSPAPTSGTIIVEKRINPTSAPKQSIRFNGNISYEKDNPNAAEGRFFLEPTGTTPDSESFIRAAGTDWSFEEVLPSGGSFSGLDGPTCTSTPASGGQSSTWQITGARVTVSLAARDTVRCTYINNYGPPPVGSLVIRKATLDGTGTFRYAFDDGPFNHVATTTSDRGVAVDAAPVVTGRNPGPYDLVEDMPAATDAGRWSLVNVFCGAEPMEVFDTDRADRKRIRVVLPTNRGQVCTFTNRFRPHGEIRVRKRTLGGVGTTRFQVRPTEDTEVEYEQLATTTAEDDPVLARGDDTVGIPLGRYAIQETTASVEGDLGLWIAAHIACDRALEWSEQGRIVFTLTRDNPTIDCTFTNRLSHIDPPDPAPIPPEPPAPSPPAPVDAGGVSAETADNLAELRITKSGTPRRVTLGERVRYRIVVRNRGPAIARYGDDRRAQPPASATTRPRPCQPGQLPAAPAALLLARPLAAGRASDGDGRRRADTARPAPERGRRQHRHPAADFARQGRARADRGRPARAAALHRLTPASSTIAFENFVRGRARLCPSTVTSTSSSKKHTRSLIGPASSSGSS